MLLFIIGLILSGVTAFPLVWELEILSRFIGIAPDADYHTLTGLQYWIGYVREGLRDTAVRYPYLAYGTDWLAFGHIIIALFFLGPYFKPTEGQWTLITGMIACVLVIPLALICGPIRGIPFYWQLIDCSFGIFGILPLLYCYRIQQRLQGAG